MKTLLAWLILCGAAFSQITVPPESPEHTIIEASVTAPMPAGATLDGGWKIPEGVDHRQVNANMIYMVAAPGEYVLKYNGFWLHLKDVTFKDGDGNEITITSYLGHGYIDEEAPFRVAGEVAPDPDPDPDPIVGPKQVMFFLRAEDLDKMPGGQRDIVTSLIIRKDLENRGHKFLQVIDDDQIKAGVPAKWKSWVDAVMGDPLPRVAFAPKEGGPIVDVPMPDNYAQLLLLLEGEQ